MTNNYDPSELAKFASLAAHWWDSDGALKTLHQINPIRVDYIKKKLTFSNKKIIDIGCGGGILTESMAKLGGHIAGIDMDQSVIKVAKLHQLASHTQIEYLHTSAEFIAKERPAHYDIVTCLEMLEHVPNPCSIIKACATLVKSGGQLFFSTLNRTLTSYLFAILGAEYIFKLLPKNTHDYAKLIKPSELADWLRQANLTLQEIKGISYHPFTKEFKLTENVSINYLFYATK